MGESFSFAVSAAVDQSTTSAQHLITLPTWAPRLGRLLAVTAGAGESTSLNTIGMETGVESFSDLAPGYASLNGNNQLALGDTVSANTVLTVRGDSEGGIQQPTAAFSAVPNG